MDCATIRDTIVEWLKNQLKESGQIGFVLGISGGVDSALVSTLCALTNMPTWLLSMPIHQAIDQVKRGNDHINWLRKKFSNINVFNTDLTAPFESIQKTFPECVGENALAMANTRSRLRMVTLYAFAGHYKLLVAGTGNMVEDYGVGFFTKYGDGGVDISPIGSLFKTQVWELAKFIGVNEDIIKAKPTDGLWADNRRDEDVIGAKYPELEQAMEICNALKIESIAEYEKLKKINIVNLSENQEKILYIYLCRHEATRHKIKVPPICLIENQLKNS